MFLLTVKPYTLSLHKYYFPFTKLIFIMCPHSQTHFMRSTNYIMQFHPLKTNEWSNIYGNIYIFETCVMINYKYYVVIHFQKFCSFFNHVFQCFRTAIKLMYLNNTIYEKRLHKLRENVKSFFQIIPQWI